MEDSQNGQNNLERIQEKSFFDELAKIQLEISGLLQPIELNLNSSSYSSSSIIENKMSVEQLKKNLSIIRDQLSKYNGLISRVREWLDEEFIGIIDISTENNNNKSSQQTKERITMKLEHCQQDFQRLEKQWKQLNRQFILKSEQLSKQELFSTSSNEKETTTNKKEQSNSSKKQKYVCLY